MKKFVCIVAQRLFTRRYCHHYHMNVSCPLCQIIIYSISCHYSVTASCSPQGISYHLWHIGCFLIQWLVFNHRRRLIIKFASKFQGHGYPLNLVCLSIKACPLSLRYCYWNSNKPLPGKVYIICMMTWWHGKFWALLAICEGYHRPPLDSPRKGLLMRNVDISFGVSPNKLFTNQLISKWISEFICIA